MLFIRTLTLLSLFLLMGCKSTPAPLPQSEKLSPASVKEIAARIDRRHGDLSSEMRQRILETVVRSIDNMVFIEGGEFEMGDFGIPCEYDPSDMCEWPCGLAPEEMCPITMFTDDDHLHEVRLSSFYLSRYHTTLGDFDLFRSAHGKELFDKRLRSRSDLEDDYLPNKPAHTKEWQEVKVYCLWLGELSGYPVDLPTEAQWEYAARNGGQYVWYPTDNGSLNFGRNYPPESKGMLDPTFPVGSFPPNPLGLYDMVGNAQEWVNDWYTEDYYKHSSVENPRGPAKGTKKVMRGTHKHENPWSAAHSVLRRDVDLQLKYYSPIFSFRCSIQMAKPID
jgi:sulfatase modifying factor 1